MKKNIYIFCVFLGITVSPFLTGTGNISAQISGDYPYFESFMSGSKPDDVIVPDPDDNTVQFKAKGAVLTPEPADENKFGALILNNHSFDASAGIFVSFEYMIYGGTGGDGLTLFFFDASQTPSIGATGRGIGYTYNRSFNGTVWVPELGQYIDMTQYRAEGLNGAYLGIAFDSYGNFKKAFYEGEKRANGLPFLSGGATGSGALQKDTRNDVVLRGAKSPTPLRPGNIYPGFDVGYVGYPVLVQQSTMENIGHELNTAGNYAYITKNQLKPETTFFPIKGGYEFERPHDPGYRRAYVELFPNNETSEGGFFVSVMIENENRRDTVIDNYLYRKSFTYLENAINNANGDNSSATEVPRASSPSNVLDATVPAALKIGFAAATGEEDDTHVIKNVRLILPRAAEAYDDFALDAFQRETVTFEPLKNDIGYTGMISRIQNPCPACIDGNTFRFVLDDGTEIYDDGANIIEYPISDVGVWRYNKTTETVTFTSIGDFEGPARIRYNVKGGKGGEYPYDQEPYRSTPATIGVNIIENPNPPGSTYIISNKMVTSKLRQ